MKRYLCLLALVCSISTLSLAQTKKLTGQWGYNRKNYNIEIEYQGSPTATKIEKIKIDNKNFKDYLDEISRLTRESKDLRAQLNGKTTGKNDTCQQKLQYLNEKVDSLQELLVHKDDEFAKLNKDYKQQEETLHRQVDSLLYQLNVDSKKSNDKNLKKTIKEKEDEIKRIRSDAEKNAERCANQLQQIEREKKQLQATIDEMASNAGSDVQSCQKQLNAIRKQLDDKQIQFNHMNEMVQTIMTELQLRPHPNQDTLQLILEKIQSTQTLDSKSPQTFYNMDFLSIDVGLGHAFIYSSLHTIEKSVAGMPSWSAKATYSHYFSDNIPLALSAGIAFEKSSFYNMMNDTTIVEKDYLDPDKDKCDVYCTYLDVCERMSLTYLSVPVYLMYGNTFKGCGIQGWAKVGLEASVNIGKSFSGSKGTYSTMGHYNMINNQVVDVWMEDVPSLGFNSNQPLFPDNSEPYTMSTFLLLGTVEVGIYIPVTSKVGFSLGAHLTHSLFTSVMKSKEVEYLPDLSHHFIFDEQKVKLMNYGIRIGLNIIL